MLWHTFSWDQIMTWMATGSEGMTMMEMLAQAEKLFN